MFGEIIVKITSRLKIWKLTWKNDLCTYQVKGMLDERNTLLVLSNDAVRQKVWKI